MNEVGRAFAIANLWGQCYNDGTYTNMCILCNWLREMCEVLSYLREVYRGGFYEEE